MRIQSWAAFATTCAARYRLEAQVDMHSQPSHRSSSLGLSTGGHKTTAGQVHLSINSFNNSDQPLRQRQSFRLVAFRTSARSEFSETANMLARHADALYRFQQVRVEFGEAPSTPRSSRLPASAGDRLVIRRQCRQTCQKWIDGANGL